MQLDADLRPDHLTTAWNAAYGLAHDPTKAHSEAIKAAEAALAPIISPHDLHTTLGKMISAVRDKPGKWALALDITDPTGVEVVLNVMNALWKAHNARHAGNRPTPKETLEQARAAVQLAVVLVQFASSGAFRRVQ